MRVFCYSRQIHCLGQRFLWSNPRGLTGISIFCGIREASNHPSSTTSGKSVFVLSKLKSINMPASAANGDIRPVLQFAKLTDNAKTPTRGSENAAGYDLYSAVAAVIPARGKAIVNTDIQIAVPDGCYGRVAPRSGLAAKNFIDVGAGVIDHDYRGNVGVVMFNFSETDFEVKQGDRIAQLICEKIFYPDLEELPSLSKTARGSGGYGSTGTN